MMRSFLASQVAAVGLALILATPGSASAEGEQVRNAGSITVMKPVHFRGKPPYRRAAVAIGTEDPMARQLVSTGTHVGPPGKQGAWKRRAFVENTTPVEEFARFEADPGAKSLPRRPWRGAPGKGRRLLSE